VQKFIFNGWEFPSIKAEPPVERFLKIIMSPEVNGYKEATVLFSHIPPGSSSGRHSHTSDEIMYIATGRGESVVGTEKQQIQTDSVVYAPRGIEHECKNTSGTETLKIFCVYIPPLKPSPLLQKLIEKTQKDMFKANAAQ